VAVATVAVQGNSDTLIALTEVDFDAFAATRWKRLPRTAYLLTGDDHEAEDLVQVTLAKAYPHWARIRRLDSPDVYRHRAMVNNSLSRHRRRRARHLLMPWVPGRPQQSATAQVEQRSSCCSRH
jgi:DNA-directed RNA polymerase specialized sigma24 family protein